MTPSPMKLPVQLTLRTSLSRSSRAPMPRTEPARRQSARAFPFLGQILDSHSDRATAKRFLAAVNFLELLANFGSLDEEASSCLTLSKLIIH